MVGPDYDGMNAPAISDSKKNVQDWLVLSILNQKIIN